LNPQIISTIHGFLNNISIVDIHSNYDANELNQNGVYPELWHNDNSTDMAFNERQLSEDLIELKTLIGQATEQNDYILVFIG
jgi:hypothetical protein